MPAKSKREMLQAANKRVVTTDNASLIDEITMNDIPVAPEPLTLPQTYVKTEYHKKGAKLTKKDFLFEKKTQKTTLAFPPTLFEAAKVKCESLGISFNKYVETLIYRDLD